MCVFLFCLVKLCLFPFTGKTRVPGKRSLVNPCGTFCGKLELDGRRDVDGKQEPDDKLELGDTPYGLEGRGACIVSCTFSKSVRLRQDRGHRRRPLQFPLDWPK